MQRAHRRIGEALLALVFFLLPAVASAGDLPPVGSFPSVGWGVGPEPEAPQCDPPSSSASMCSCGGGKGDVGGSNPVNAVAGQMWHEETDLVVPGVFPIELRRRYDSQRRYDSPLGYGWAWDFDLRLFEYPDDSVVIRQGCGYRHRFVASGGGYVAEGGRRDELVDHGDGTWTLVSPRGQKTHFDGEGRLEALEDPHGNRLEMTYGSTKQNLTGTSPTALDPTTPMVVAEVYPLQRIDEVLASTGNPSGRYVTFSYDGTTGRLTEAEAWDGRSVTYVHDTTAGSTKGDLVQVNGLAGIVHTYGYDAAHNLTSLRDATGAALWTTTYDAEDRVVTQTRGDRVFTTDYTDPLRTVVTRSRADHLGDPLPAAVESYEYTPSGHLVRKTDALGNETRYTLDAQNLRTKEELWWNQGTVASPSLVLQRTTTFGYDLDGNLTSRSVTLDSSETVTESWTYDHFWVASYQVVSSAAPSKLFRTEYTFYRDGEGRPTNVHQIERRRDDASYQTTTLTYDPNGQLATITPPEVDPDDELEIVRSYYAATDTQVSRRGLLESEELEVGGTPDAHLARSFDYDARGFLSEVTDARSNTTAFTNDALGRVIGVTNPLGEETLYTYAGPNEGLGHDPMGWNGGPHLAQVEVGRTTGDGEGQVQQLFWDSEGRLTSIQRKDDGGTWSTFMAYAYDSDDHRTRQTDGESRTTAFAYDRLGRLTSITDAASTPNVTTFAYDAAGNRTQVVDALGRKTVLVYDDLDRLLQSQAHGSTGDPISPALVTAFAYDAAGNVTLVTDPKSQETTYAYSSLSELLSVEQDLGETVSYAYDERGRLERLTNARGHALQYAYHPWGGLEAVEHYPTAADAAASTNLQRTVSYAYDASGNVTSTGDTDYHPTTPTLETTTYDAVDRPDTVTVKYLPGGDRTLEHGYDRFGNRESLVFTDGSDTLSHTWTYDDLDRLTEAQLADADPLTFTYYGSDDLETITRGSGAAEVTTTYTYHPEGPIETITTTSPSTQLLKLTYAVDEVLNIETVTEQHGSTDPTHTYTYGYDALDRLTSASYPTALGLPGGEAFEYDAAGNRETPGSPSDYAYDANNRITASPGKAWVYDDDGNPETVNDGLSDEETFTYDYTNRMRGYTNATTSTTASYLYDPFGRRIQKTVDSTTTWFVWDGDQLLGEFDGSGNRQRRYTYTGGFAPAEQVEAGSPETVSQIHTDHLDTPRALTSSSASAVWRGAYQAFGTVAIGTSTVNHAIRFPGQYADAESGLYYNLHRTYDPISGRFPSEDPIGQAGGLNVFTYVMNRPTTWSDPSGLTSALGALLRGGLPGARFASPFGLFRGARRSAVALAGAGTPEALALQHCIASCEFAEAYGVWAAREAGNAYEVWTTAVARARLLKWYIATQFGPPYPTRPLQQTSEDLMEDLANNAVGRSLACHGGCEAVCWGAWQTGGLQHHHQGHRSGTEIGVLGTARRIWLQ